MYKRKLLLISIIFGTFVGFIFIFKFYTIFFLNNTKFKNDYSYVFIDRDDTIDSLKNQLLPLLKSIKDFDIAAYKKGYTYNIKPGKYKIDRGMGNNKIINSLRSKRLAVKVTFNNQERLEDLAGRISYQIEADSLDLLNSFKNISFLKEFGFNEENALSMYFPNTYEVYWDILPDDFRKKMENYFKSFWDQKRLNLAKAIKLNPKEIYILASIVQKESVKNEEKNRIAGVYINRLRRNMKLQADPTVIYALKKLNNNYNRIIKRVLYRDLKIESLYNTYRYKGLPPGPISMPDISSIEAVLNYEKHDYLYFVVSPSKPGYHLFSKSLNKHNENKKKYTRWLNKYKIYR